MRLCVLSTGRQDWGILRSTCVGLLTHGSHDLLLMLGGMHCDPAFGNTGAAVIAEGFHPVEQLAWTNPGEAVTMIGEAFARHRPDALLVVGDRSETAAAGLAATIAQVPIIHLHGGEETAGSFDNAFRHALTKLSHLHLVSHPDHARRVIALGEDPALVHVVGAPGLDNLHRNDLPDRAELERTLAIELRSPVVLVTHHPATLGGNPMAEVTALVAAMDRVDATYVITLPNNDPGSKEIRRALEAVGHKSRRCAVDALGERRYFGMMQIADAMIGNSSSGLIEAPAVRLPVVNIGDRQAGRLRGDNVLDVAAETEAIASALERALAPDFRAQLDATGPFGDGHAAERILKVLDSWQPPRPPRKAPVRI